MILCSIWRDSGAQQVKLYDHRVRQLRALTDERVEIVAVEGDSTDDTYLQLMEICTPLKVEHGGPYYDSTDNPARWRQLAVVCNVALTAAVRQLERDESLVYIESDLRWEPEMILRLVEHTKKYPAVSPLSLCQNERFYDVFGHRKDGHCFNPWYPYYEGQSESMTQIDSSGSCVALSWSAAQVVEFSQHDCIRGIGRTLYQHGLSLWLDPTLKVEHP